jgi:hypothetical protein
MAILSILLNCPATQNKKNISKKYLAILAYRSVFCMPNFAAL